MLDTESIRSEGIGCDVYQRLHSRIRPWQELSLKLRTGSVLQVQVPTRPEVVYRVLIGRGSILGGVSGVVEFTAKTACIQQLTPRESMLRECSHNTALAWIDATMIQQYAPLMSEQVLRQLASIIQRAA